MTESHQDLEHIIIETKDLPEHLEHILIEPGEINESKSGIVIDNEDLPDEESEDPAPICLYCHAPCIPEQAIVKCKECGTIYHREHWYENDGCGQMGCRGAHHPELCENI
jgi:hypothetical protein